MTQNVSHAVMAQRVEPHDSLDFFPTPPWATRALCEWLQDQTLHGSANISRHSVWEPACGEGHMAQPLAEYFDVIHATDIHDYGYSGVVDFLFAPEYIGDAPNWIITNPPFRLASQFISTALPRAQHGVAMLCRSVFLESGARYRGLFEHDPPSDVLIFCERVPMLKGRLDRKASSATSYSWFVWRKPCDGETRLHWIPPGTRRRLERDEDYTS